MKRQEEKSDTSLFLRLSSSTTVPENTLKITSAALFQTFSKTNITKVCPGSQCMFAFYGGESVYHRYIVVFHLCNLFVFLWLVNFTIALGQCTLAGAFASYYWALKKPKDIPACPLYSSFSRAIRWARARTQTLHSGYIKMAWKSRAWMCLGSWQTFAKFGCNIKHASKMMSKVFSFNI